MPWYKLEEAAWEEQMKTLASWEVDGIVAPQYFYRPAMHRSSGFVRKVADMAMKYGIRIKAAHGLLGKQHDLGLADAAALRDHECFLCELASVGVKTYTVHAGTQHFPADQASTIPESFWSCLKNSIDRLLPIAEKLGILIALENIYEPPFLLEKLLETCHQFSHPNFGLCFDAGHANLNTRGLAWVFQQMKDGIVTCHLHDNDGITDLHAAPGAGNIDFSKLAAELRKLPRLVHIETETREFSETIWRDFQRLII